MPSARIAARRARACRPRSSRATLALEEQLRRELLSLDQTLRILEYEWQRDPDHFDLAARASQVVVLSDVSLQLFIADARGHRAVQLASGDHRHRHQQAATTSAMKRRCRPTTARCSWAT